MQVVPAAWSCLSTIKTVAFDAGQPCPVFSSFRQRLCLAPSQDDAAQVVFLARASTFAREVWQKVFADKVSAAHAERGQLLQLLRHGIVLNLLTASRTWCRWCQQLAAV